jgi:hypothetical protein
MYLEQAVTECDVIIIGETVKIVETANDEALAPRGIATIRVERIIKGTARSGEIDIIYQPCVQAGSPKYYLCEKCIFFLERVEADILSGVLFENVHGQYITTGEYLGKIDIRRIDNMAIGILLKDEEMNQDLDKFLQKMERLIGK